ncbi:MAG: Ivy family c-type lysozyme inhibitor [Candidatus Latescibacteria bacterium]|nr:Ivy family c-type lysozyme inhibitor [Candidatus Latescibacterota bacterium]
MNAYAKILLAISLLLVIGVASACIQCPDREHPTDDVPPTPTYALHELSASGILTDPVAKAAYDAALGPWRRESWLADLDGPSALNEMLTIDGEDYLLASACKNHDCAEHNVVLLYAAARGRMYGLINQLGITTFIGEPSPVLSLALGRAWRERFR